ncbi:general transcription factor II-I repeat domain-containing protein 2-like [Palaemon carinicauda]|uniref:general transcription factor II-I repeat domain-containing protein 2-like n=1 Tax=Palaemon carinicauda TaxID=392227 RepID=UPI0035B57770
MGTRAVMTSAKTAVFMTSSEYHNINGGGELCNGSSHILPPTSPSKQYGSIALSDIPESYLHLKTWKLFQEPLMTQENNHGREELSAVNFIRSRGLNHREFQQLMVDIDAEYSDIKYFCEVRWLSKAGMLKRAYDLLEEIQLFLDMKGNAIPELRDKEWRYDLAFLVDITDHLSALNVRLQGKDQLKHSYAIEICASPSSVDITAIPKDMQMEIIELQCYDELRKKFDDNSIYQFYKKHESVTVYPKLSVHARKMMAVFGSTYTLILKQEAFKLLCMPPRNKENEDE